MDVVYQLTFLLALALLAILITVFVFAISLLGRALETAARNERDKLNERKENNAKDMAAIKKDIEDAEAKGEIPKGLKRKLDELEKRDLKFDKELQKIRKAPELLTVKGGVVPPGAALLVAIILSGLAWSIADIEMYIPITLWVIGMLSIGFSIFYIYNSLRVIESVAITSEAEAERRLAQAVKVALTKVEEEKKPELIFLWIDEEGRYFLPHEYKVEIEAGLEEEWNFGLMLVHGIEAKNVSFFINAPNNFSFPGKNIVKQSASHTIHPNYVSIKIECSNVRRGVVLCSDFKIKAPNVIDSYTLYYRIIASGFDSGAMPFKVVTK